MLIYLLLFIERGIHVHVVLTLYMKITDASIDIQDCLQLQIQLKISMRLT